MLVVDDNRDAADSLGAMLEMMGASARVVYGGPDALAAAQEQPPRLVLLDLGMPGMDGYEVVRQLAAHPQRSRMHVVALTGWGQAEDRQRTREPASTSTWSSRPRSTRWRICCGASAAAWRPERRCVARRGPAGRHGGKVSRGTARRRRRVRYARRFFHCRRMTSPNEPSTTAPPVRRFRDPAYRPVAGSLAELRQRIDDLDDQIVALLAQRADCVRDATRFKRDAFQVQAPARQAQVFERVRALAAAHETAFPGLPDIVESAYRTLVAGYIAAEDQLFQQTEAIEP